MSFKDEIIAEGHATAEIEAEADVARAQEEAAAEQRDRDAAARAHEPRFLPASSFKPEPVDWIWRGRIARRKLNLIVGHPGRGKSAIACDLAARVSAGLDMPFEDVAAAPAGVLLICPEDSPSDTLVPRLIAAGADMRRVHLHHPESTLPSLDRHLAVLEQTITEEAIGLVVFDPITGLLGGVDAHKEQEVRALLDRVGQAAERTGCAVVSVMHLNKRGEGSPLTRALGSMGFVARHRMVLLVGDHPEKEDERVIAPMKANVAREATALSFRLDPFTPDKAATFGRSIETIRLNWLSECDLTAEDLVNDRAQGAGAHRRRDEAVAFLRETLANGPLAFEHQVRPLATTRGVAVRTLRRAAIELGVAKSRRDYQGNPASYWSLPSAASLAKCVPADRVGQVGQVDAPEEPTEAVRDHDAEGSA